MRNLLDKINISKTICDHVLSPNHTKTHRMCCGTIIAFVGVSISKIHVEFMVVHYFLDGVGYAIHAIGATPFIDAILSSVKSEDANTNQDEKEN